MIFSVSSINNIEIERKFLVKDESYKSLATGKVRIQQGYLSLNPNCNVRIRRWDNQAFLTIKSKANPNGFSRYEFEKEITLEEVEELFKLALPGTIDKWRWLIPLENGLVCEVDEFLGENEGLVMAEVELPSEETEFVHPAFLGEEVTQDRRYYNSYLSQNPYRTGKNQLYYLLTIYTTIMTTLFLSFVCAVMSSVTLLSPDDKTQATLSLSPLTLTVTHNGVEMLSPSEIGLEMENTQLGAWKLTSNAQMHQEVVKAPVYHRDSISTSYRELTLSNRNLKLVIRAYNQGVAYRFVYTGKKEQKVFNEIVRYYFADDPEGFFPYVRHGGEWNTQFQTSHENYYTRTHISGLKNDLLLFNPVLVDRPNGYRTLLMEADLRHYPGMYLLHDSATNALCARFAPVPDSVRQGVSRWVREDVITRHDHIAVLSPKQAMPWRVVCVSEQDKDLADNNFVYLLSTPCQLDDTDWIRPGKVAWDWWNSWNLTGVPFEAGINTETYKYYIDFASKYGIEYVILDEGWSMPKQNDLTKVVPEIDLEALIAHGREKNVKIILWAGYGPFVSDMEHTVQYFSQMGVAGFKIDFLDRDDQLMVDFVEKAAALTAQYRMLIDYHGIYKPTGIQRMYPNVLNFEGVFGMEQLRKPKELDQMNYDVTIPFTRLAAGPADYTQGAMRNGTQETFRFNKMEPMSQGTRCHQLAEYVVFFAPLTMLCDAPTLYEKEDECTRAIAAVPTTWDETKILDGKVGEYIVTARRKGDTWYIGALTNWTPRDLTIDLSQLKMKNEKLKIAIFKDGANAHRNATDYLHESFTTSDTRIPVHLAPGGGCLMTVNL